MHRKRPGFTLMEMVIVIGILAVVAGLVMGKFDERSDNYHTSAFSRLTLTCITIAI